MKIVYLLGMFEPIGGQEFYLARQQAKQGAEVIIVTSDTPYLVPGLRERYRREGLPPALAEHRPGEIEYEGMQIIRLPTIFHYHDFIVVRGIKETLTRLRPDVVFGHEARTIVPVAGARYKRDLKYIFFLDSHDLFHKVQNHRFWRRWLRYAEYFWWRRWFVDYALKAADTIIAVAPECRRFLEERHRVAPDRIRDLPLGVETDFFRYDAKARKAQRAIFGVPNDAIVLLFAGYMFRRKALESLIDLVATLQDVPLRLVFAGEGPEGYLQELRRHAQAQGVADRVHFAGFLSRAEIAALYSAADIGIWPGNNSLVILEAMACRLPIIMADMQLKHLASHENGVLVPYADAQAMQTAVRQLAADATLRERMGTNGELAAREHYSYAALARQVSAWMETALAQRRR